jgi:hypothetical protein
MTANWKHQAIQAPPRCGSRVTALLVTVRKNLQSDFCGSGAPAFIDKKIERSGGTFHCLRHSCIAGNEEIVHTIRKARLCRRERRGQCETFGCKTAVKPTRPYQAGQFVESCHEHMICPITFRLGVPRIDRRDHIDRLRCQDCEPRR